jgi:hypothetical protein
MDMYWDRLLEDRDWLWAHVKVTLNVGIPYCFEKTQRHGIVTCTTKRCQATTQLAERSNCF